ncbi:MAG: phospho-N-acetylmuramoyl-pentapeptide-transferase [Candidatus Cloacimonadota bacterium]|nr:MAG: phospho-N-acetylmuramoyl-pentapeptide-transferase [Candidatus Cloacimonadota bacterium]PIE82044.1 MAG: phospho-N-acetylmuramoyl-pentapeptide-transferase [Candidatus Delongbacteria bacterium]
MFYYLSNLSNKYELLSFFRLFDSILFRSTASMITALLVSIIFGRHIINILYKLKIRDVVRDYQGISANDKKGTPTMGGIIIILSISLSLLIWSNLGSVFVITTFFSLIWFGVLGAVDDYYKIKFKDSDKGLSQFKKFLFQIIAAVVIAYVFTLSPYSPFSPEEVTKLYLPFAKSSFGIELGLFYPIFLVLVIVSIANAVNFADGMDGLAIVPSITSAAVFGLLAYIVGNYNFSSYLLYKFVPGTGEMLIVAASLIGSGMGFLWYNSYPASVFMGDTGSMAIGGVLAVLVISVKQEFLFAISGGIFVAEAFSVLVQEKIGINMLGRRIFYRAPLHDTFKYMGSSETKIVQRLWILSIILSLVALLSIKIR